MPDIDGDHKRALFQALVDRILDGNGVAAPALRAHAFGNDGLAPPLEALINKVATAPTSVTEADFAAAQAAGFTEDQLFELVVCGAVGQAARRYDAGLAALASASGSAGAAGQVAGEAGADDEA